MILEDQLTGYGKLQEDVFGPISRDEIIGRPTTTQRSAIRYQAFVRHPVAVALAAIVAVVLILGDIAFLSPVASQSPVTVHLQPAPGLSRLTVSMTLGNATSWNISDSAVTNSETQLQLRAATLEWIWVTPCYSASLGFVDPPVMRSHDGIGQGLTHFWGEDVSPPSYRDQANPTTAATLPAISPVRSVTLAGYDAHLFELHIPDQLEIDRCNGGVYRLWVDITGHVEEPPTAGVTYRIWTVDVPTADFTASNPSQSHWLCLQLSATCPPPARGELPTFHDPGVTPEMLVIYAVLPPDASPSTIEGLDSALSTIQISTD